MKYLMLVCVEKGYRMPPEESATIGSRTQKWVDEADGSGTRVFGSQLNPVEQAKTVRIRGGKRTVTDGPFVETKEQIGGFDILECSSMEEAVEVASRHPAASFGTLELRQLMGS